MSNENCEVSLCSTKVTRSFLNDYTRKGRRKEKKKKHRTVETSIENSCTIRSLERCKQTVRTTKDDLPIKLPIYRCTKPFLYMDLEQQHKHDQRLLILTENAKAYCDRTDAERSKEEENFNYNAEKILKPGPPAP